MPITPAEKYFSVKYRVEGLRKERKEPFCLRVLAKNEAEAEINFFNKDIKKGVKKEDDSQRKLIIESIEESPQQTNES